jgi:hypothetical protein
MLIRPSRKTAIPVTPEISDAVEKGSETEFKNVVDMSDDIMEMLMVKYPNETTLEVFFSLFMLSLRVGFEAVDCDPERWRKMCGEVLVGALEQVPPSMN